MKWLTTISKALAAEPEDWIAYRYGQEVGKLPDQDGEKALSRKGLHGLVAAYVELLKKASFSGGRKLPGRSIFIYIKTINQYNSIVSIEKSLSKFAISSLSLFEYSLKKYARGGDDYKQVKLSLWDVLKVAILIMVRSPHMIGLLTDKRFAHLRIDHVVKIYASLVYFERTLREVNPSIVLVANDHSIPHRSLTVLTKFMGIKTAYVQHASVSEIFPALSFDYSFLDGIAALETYSKCEKNRPASAIVPDRRYVFLTGQQKVIKKTEKELVEPIIGVAINTLDKTASIVRLVMKLHHDGHSVCLRWHPGMDAADVGSLKSQCVQGDGRLYFSDPKVEPLSYFFGRITTLVAGNSSIHLEAALGGILTVYYAFEQSELDDYYGYVRKGLSLRADDLESLCILLNADNNSFVESRLDAIRYYSATYQTEWEGREGELVAAHLHSLLEGIEPPGLWGCRDFPMATADATTE